MPTQKEWHDAVDEGIAGNLVPDFYAKAREKDAELERREGEASRARREVHDYIRMRTEQPE